MAYCSNCGAQIDNGGNVCNKCGATIGTQPAPQAAPQLQSQSQPKTKRGCATCLIVVLAVLLIMLFLCSGSFFFALSVVGAKGQPGTIVPPSEAGPGKVSGATVPIPQGLSASPGESSIDLKWQAISGVDINKYKVYRSEKPDQKYSEVAKVEANTSSYSDKDAKKGITYYYVVTAVAKSGAESGNSKSVSAVIDTPPLIPQGIYSWNDVKAKAEADSAYLKLFIKVTGLNKSDIDRFASKEKQGQSFKTTLVKGTIITNTTEDYKVVPNFVLNKDRDALMDESGRPHVLTRCGNPMKLQVPVTTTAVVIQQVQVFITTIVMILPPPVTNVIINAGQAANVITIAVLPGSTIIQIGPDFAPPPPGVFVDPADFGEDIYRPEADIELEEGQKWIEKGKLLITANPPDPEPGQSVSMTVKLFPAEEGVPVSYSVEGTDGYAASGQQNTNSNGEIIFTIPGGASGIHDVIKISIPSKNLQGSTEYVF